TVPVAWTYPRHDHPYFELCVLEAGEQHTRLTGHTLIQHPGDILLLCPFDAHGSSAPLGATLFCMHFDVDEMALRRLLCRAGSRVFQADSPVARQLHTPLQQLRNLSLASDSHALVQRLQLTSHLFAFFAELAQALLMENHHLPELSQATLQTASRLAERIERAVENGTPLFSIESAIKQLGYHPDHGNAMFRQAFGFSARQYRSSLKLRRAKMLLLDNALGIGEVAQRLGYDDGMRFSRQFKRWCGLSPSQFRAEIGLAKTE
ncbi:MAG: AraC family transcriptional regulator, partial [Pseudomonadota bacterium]